MRFNQMGLEMGRAAVVGAVCSMLVGQPVFAAAGRTGVPVGKTAGQIQGDARVLHALNRLTFGPRPGDVQRVEAMGLDRWFEQQLNPGTIDDAALEERLAAFPAMRLPQEELMLRFPSPAVIRRMAHGDFPLPSGALRPVYADQIAFYQMKVAAKGAVVGGKKAQPTMPQPAVSADGGSSTNGMMDAKAGAVEQAKVENAGADPLAVAPEEHVQELYPEDVTERILAMGPDARVAVVMGMEPRDLAGFRRSLSKRELLELVAGMTPEQKEMIQALGGSLRVIGQEIGQERLMRDIYSDRQLEAVMTDFWLNHFNVYAKKSQVEPYLIPAFERDVVRPRALGKFDDLLVAVAKSPAMLVYLDNWQSTGPDSLAAQRAAGRQGLFLNTAQKAKRPSGLNENYARELMELHTLGVGGGYTQADVTQVAKVFTGWTIDEPYRVGAYTFIDRRHEPGAKTVLGKTIPEGGEREGLEVLHMLATSPATARFISTKLAVRFVSDDPPAALVDRMAGAFLSSGGDMKVVLRTMFHSPEFWSQGAYRAKVKTPIEFVASAVRASDASVNNAAGLMQALDRLGMPLFGMQTPNGYSWKEDEWVSTGALVNRMNFALLLAGDRVNGVRTQWPVLLGDAAGVLAVSSGGGEGSVEAAKEAKLETILLGEGVSERTRATVLAQFDGAADRAEAEKNFGLKDADGMGGGMQRARRDGAAVDPEAAGMAGLLLGSPEFQRR